MPHEFDTDAPRALCPTCLCKEFPWCIKEGSEPRQACDMCRDRLTGEHVLRVSLGIACDEHARTCIKCLQRVSSSQLQEICSADPSDDEFDLLNDKDEKDVETSGDDEAPEEAD